MFKEVHRKEKLLVENLVVVCDSGDLAAEFGLGLYF